MSAWHGGKGSKRRKGEDLKAYEDNWDRIFGNKKAKVILENGRELNENKTDTGNSATGDS